MCGRYYIPEGHELADINAMLALIKSSYVGTAALAQMKSGEIFPTDIVPIITQEAPKLMQWGFEGLGGKGKIINARLETAADKAMFRKAFASQRCLVPAGYYFEWKKDGAKKEKFAIKKSEPIYMAGLWHKEANDAVPLFVILTREASPELKFIHDCMPVILPKQERDSWLSGKSGAMQLAECSEEHFTFESVG
ncbi:MAG: SOS response-associated peptidase [Clostridia bacterium]|nr:SOS response-associated peptidase [Clostridia bacterium]